MSGDLRLFFQQLARQPHRVVALAPSASGLCAEMARELRPGAGPVVELGAGTGRITQAILDRGIDPGDLHAIELNSVFCAHLRSRFPAMHVHQMSAGDIGDLPLASVQAVVSGLPLLSMPLALQRAIIAGACRLLSPGGTFTQFTYGPKPPVAKPVRDAFHLDWTASDKIWRNLPPARVYRFWPVE